ncbi:MAG: hypothetical protein ACLP1X_16105 [Polyangiaceae bacterium]
MGWSLASATAWAAGNQGDFLQTDTLGMNILNHQFDTGKTSTLANEAVLSEFVGAHYYFVDRVRLGMNFQFSEQLEPAPATADGSRLRTFALLPQIGWDFWGPMFAALVVTVAPWTSGTGTFDFGPGRARRGYPHRRSRQDHGGGRSPVQLRRPSDDRADSAARPQLPVLAAGLR